MLLQINNMVKMTTKNLLNEPTQTTRCSQVLNSSSAAFQMTKQFSSAVQWGPDSTDHVMRSPCQFVHLLFQSHILLGTGLCRF